MYHTLEHAVHVAHGRSQDIDSGGLDVLLGFRRGGQTLRQVGGFFMDFRAGSDVADLPLDNNGRIDRFDGFDRLSGSAHILLEGQRRKVKHDGIKPRLGCFEGLRQGMRMISVEKDREIEFFPQTMHQSGNLTGTHELALTLGSANEHRHVDLSCRSEHCIQQNGICDVEMTDCHPIFLRLLYNSSQALHGYRRHCAASIFLRS
jgi:hypothetical protein